MDFNISIVLDERRLLKNDKYPIKLRVYSVLTQEVKLFSLNRNYHKKDFDNITSRKPSKLFKEESLIFQKILSKAHEIAKHIEPFSIVEFQRRVNSRKMDKNNIVEYYLQKISELKSKDQVKTASNYLSSLKSIQIFKNPSNPESVKSIHVLEITPDWLNNYEKHMLLIGKSISTVGIYLRPLRCIYNLIIDENPSYKHMYPFTKSRYQIPATRKVKKSLSSKELKILFEAKPQNEYQEMAKDFWFFSYSCNGINVNDIARLKFKDVDFRNETITFFRGKTYNTTKYDLVEIKIFLNNFTTCIIDKYKNASPNDDNLIFNIINKSDNEEIKKRKIDNFNRFINQHIKKLAVLVGLTKDISVYWARHSFSNRVLNQGANIEFIGEALGHKNIKTTKSYLSGFEDEQKKLILNNILNFEEN